jgi:HD-GYP domain-containing protein (c-di-GMP phosphodiesterase class II)
VDRGSAVSARSGRSGILFSILVLLFVVGLVPLIGTSLTLVRGGEQILEAGQQEVQHDKVTAFADYVEAFVDSVQARVATTARTLESGSTRGQLAQRIGRMGATNALERYMEGETPLIYLAVVDSRGDGTRSGTELPVFQAPVEAVWEKAMQGEPTLGEPTFVPELRASVLVLGEPVRPDGEVVEGAVVGVAILDRLWEVANKLARGGAYDVYLIDPTGRMIAHSNPEQFAPSGQAPSALPNLSGVEIVSRFLADREGVEAQTTTFNMETVRGATRMLGTYQRILPGELDWGVVVQVEEARAYAEVTRMRNEAILLVGAVAILAVLMGTVFAGRLTRPIRQLAGGARRLARGEYGTRVLIKSRNEVGLLADTFNHMGDEIQKAFEEIKEAARVNKELFMGSIRMLANAIDEKDPYTRGHSERVAYYSAVIAKHMGMSEDEVERVHLSGIIHDVGKIGIEDKILRKASALTDDEYEIMKQHPTKGAHILDAVPILRDMAGAGLMHHENVDGSGYPDGLKGEQIPLLGRIVSVADAFDAMTTDRPYSKAMTFEAALARLRFLVGKKFDEGSVVAMEKAMEAGDLTPAKARRASIAARQPPSQPS